MRRALCLLLAGAACWNPADDLAECERIGQCAGDGGTAGGAGGGVAGGTAGGAAGGTGGGVAGGAAGGTAGGAAGGTAGGSGGAGGCATADAGGIPTWADVQREILCSSALGRTADASVAFVTTAAATTNNKWSGGVLTPYGTIHAAPYETGTPAAVIDYDAGSITLFPANNNGQHLVGAVHLGSSTYLVPYSGSQLRKMDQPSPPAAIVGTDILDAGSLSLGFLGAVAAGNGSIYAIPNGAPRVLKYTPGGGSALIGSTYGTASKWWGGVLGPDGRIYGCPATPTVGVLVIDPSNDTTSTFPPVGGATGGWQTGAIAGDGHIYCIPHGSLDILDVNPADGGYARIATNAVAGNQGWQGAALGPDGRIYAVPSTERTVLVFDPVSRRVDYISLSGIVDDEWDGLVAEPGGRLYGIPSTGTRLLVIDPHAAGRLSMRVLLSPYLDKY